jgi:ketosteroid isomerase-like protein
MQRTCIALLLTLCASITFAQESADETAVWKLENSYWHDVKVLDLVSYRALWHADFIGWPYVSPAPQRKDHIADWIDQYTAKGLHLRSYSLRPASSHATGDIVVTYYWLTATWEDKNGHGEPETSRITHTWLRTPTGWQIFGGMSAAQPAAAHPEAAPPEAKR